MQRPCARTGGCRSHVPRVGCGHRNRGCTGPSGREGGQLGRGGAGAVCCRFAGATELLLAVSVHGGDQPFGEPARREQRWRPREQKAALN